MLCDNRMYHFEGRITRSDGYYIRETYHVSRGLLLWRIVTHVAMDAWKNWSPMGIGLRDNGCVSLRQTCINILDFAFHGIAQFIIVGL